MSRHAVAADRLVGAAGEAIIIDDGVIVDIVPRSGLGELPVVDHTDAVIVAPMIDSHIHPMGYAGLVSGTSLKESAGIDDLVDRLASIDRPGPIIAQRLDDTTLERMPTRHDLDRAWPDRPVLAYRYCGHVAVANTASLDLAGIGAGVADPPGGSIDRDDSGLPTGVLRETAIELVNAALDPLVAPPSSSEVIRALEGLVATGLTRLTGIVSTKPLWCGVGDELTTLCRLAAQLPLDIDVVVVADTVEDLHRAATEISDAGGRLHFWGWKAFADGSLGGHTAAMWGPFADNPSTGMMRLDSDHAEAMALTAISLGGVAAIHAIGDRAIDATLDVFERVIATGADPGRLRVEHASVVSDVAISRLADRGIVASIQPPFLSSEPAWVPSRLGPERPAYRFATMESAGVRMLAGSDCPVERPDPLAGIAAAVERAGWTDDEAVSVDTALAWYTTAPAAHLRLPAPLAPGSPADFVVVSGELGASTATVSAVYRLGVRERLAPVDWPG